MGPRRRPGRLRPRPGHRPGRTRRTDRRPSAPAPRRLPEPPGAHLVVSVSGKVRRPGLVEVPAGARVADALAAAGGALPGTDLTQLNLARRVNDGEQVAVGVPAAPDAAPAAGTDGIRCCGPRGGRPGRSGRPDRSQRGQRRPARRAAGNRTGHRPAHPRMAHPQRAVLAGRAAARDRGHRRATVRPAPRAGDGLMWPGTRGSDPAVGEDADRLGTRRHPPDFRLVPPALAVWAVVLLGMVLGPAVAIGLTATAAVLAAVSLRPGSPMAVRAVAGCALAAGMVITAHTVLVDRHPLRGGGRARGGGDRAAPAGRRPAPDPGPGLRCAAGRSHPGSDRRFGPAGPGRR